MSFNALQFFAFCFETQFTAGMFVSDSKKYALRHWEGIYCSSVFLNCVAGKIVRLMLILCYVVIVALAAATEPVLNFSEW